MKFVAIGLLSIVSSAALAAGTGLTAEHAQKSVISRAHSYIAQQAPDWGGSVTSPCLVNLVSDAYTVTCKGTFKETFGGGGENARKFECIGSFVQGHDAKFYKDGPIECNTLN